MQALTRIPTCVLLTVGRTGLSEAVPAADWMSVPQLSYPGYLTAQRGKSPPPQSSLAPKHLPSSHGRIWLTFSSLSAPTFADHRELAHFGPGGCQLVLRTEVAQQRRPQHPVLPPSFIGRVASRREGRGARHGRA